MHLLWVKTQHTFTNNYLTWNHWNGPNSAVSVPKATLLDWEIRAGYIQWAGTWRKHQWLGENCNNLWEKNSIIRGDELRRCWVPAAPSPGSTESGTPCCAQIRLLESRRLYCAESMWRRVPAAPRLCDVHAAPRTWRETWEGWSRVKTLHHSLVYLWFINSHALKPPCCPRPLQPDHTCLHSTCTSWH